MKFFCHCNISEYTKFFNIFNFLIEMFMQCSDKARISEHFNSFFATIGSQNENNIRKHEGSTYKNYLTNQYDCTFAFHLINNNDTLRIIKKTLRCLILTPYQILYTLLTYMYK